jgi:potassium-dependent mechanosensitive channel
MKININPLTYLLLALALCFNNAVFGQSDVSNPEEIEQEVTAISATDIVSKTEETNRFLNSIMSVTELPASITAIRDTYVKNIDQISEVNIYVDSKILEDLSVRELAEIKQKCTTYESKLSEWVTTLTDHISKIESGLQKTRKWIEVWQKTENSAKELKLPPDILSSINSTINQLRNTENNMVTQSNQLLTMQNTIASQDIILSDIITLIKKIESQKWGDLLVIDSEPLWIALFSWEEQPNPVDQLLVMMKRHNTILAEYADSNRQHIISQLLTFIFLLILFILIKRYSKTWVFETESVKVLSRPFAQAILISLLINSAFYIHAPNVVIFINRIIVMILILRLLPDSYTIGTRRLIYFFTIIHILQQIHLLTFEPTLLQRIFMLVISSSALLIAWRVIKYNMQGTLKIDTTFFRVFLILMRLTLALLIISILSNIIGNVSLAEQINYGVMHSIYGALGIAISVHIVTALIITLLYSRIANVLLIVRKEKEKIKNAITKILAALAFLFWLLLVFNAYGISEPVKELMSTIFGTRFTMGSVNISLGDIVIFGLTLYIAYSISKFIRFFLEGDVLPRIKLPRGVPATISKLTNYLIIGFGIVVALSMAGFNLSSLAFIAGALGVGIGFGLQNVVNNFISGLILIFERPIQTGDVIERGTLLGVVKKIGIRASLIRTYTGAEVIVPNGDLISQEVINWTLSDKIRRIEIAVGVAYGTDPTKVLSILKDLTKNYEGIIEKPEPMVLFLGFGDSSLDFELRFWTSSSEGWLELKSNMTVKIHEALKQAKIEIPFPQRDLHIKSAQGLQEKDTFLDTGSTQTTDKSTGTRKK